MRNVLKAWHSHIQVQRANLNFQRTLFKKRKEVEGNDDVKKKGSYAKLKA